ncbi:MAG TPA: O-antigen ligase family protein [Methylomirabilota bacterium]|nr:O-antigen ligase family protein [Methylomirabilota bacterium]
MEKKSEKILFWLASLACFSALVFSRSLVYPFESTKALYFQLLIEAALPFYLYLILSSRKFRPDFGNWLTISVIAYFLLSVISGIFGVNPSQSFWGIPIRATGIFNLAHFVLFYFYLILLFQIKPELAGKIKSVSIAAVAIACLYALWLAIGLPGFFNDPDSSSRISGLFGNPITFAAFLTIPIFVTMLQAITEKRRGWKILLSFLAVLELVIVYLTKTRAVYVGLAAGIFVGGIVYLIFSENNFLRRFRIHILASIIVLFAIAAGLAVTRLHFGDNDSRARVVEWKIALKGFAHAPILGVGPENYYVIADKYFDPQLYKYTPGWFDKPHNYFLEILTTTGILGFLAYLGILVSAIKILYDAFRGKRIDLYGFSFLIAGLTAYITQDFFSFDTVSSLLFFVILLALIGSYSLKDSKPSIDKNIPKTFGIAKIGLVISGLLMLYVAYAGNWLPMLANFYTAKAINSASPDSIQSYMDKVEAIDKPTVQLADKGFYYGTIAEQSAGGKNVDASASESLLDSSISVMVKATEEIKNNPRYWFKLANLYYYRASVAHKANQDYSEYVSKSEDALNKAIELVPSRVEFLLLSVKLKLLHNDYAGIDSDLTKIFSIVPADPNSAWQKDGNNKSDLFQILNTLIRNFNAKRDYNKVIFLYQGEIKINPSDPQLYSELAAVYAESGDKENARLTALKILELKPEAKDEVEEFLKTLQ